MTPLHGETIHIGGEQRTIRFTMTAHRIAKKRIGRPLRDVMPALAALDIDTICELAAAGLTEGRPKGSKDVVTPERVSAWLDEAPHLVAPLATATAKAIAASWERMFTGEANAAANGTEASAAATMSMMTTSSPTSETGGPTSDG